MPNTALPVLLTVLAGVTIALAALSIYAWIRLRAARRYDSDTLRFRKTFETAPVGMAHLDLNGRWMRINGRMAEIIGYTPEELERLDYQAVTHPDDVERNVALNRSLVDGQQESYSFEKRYIRKDASTHWAKITVTLIRKPDGTPDFFIAVTEDIDHLKQAQIALIESEARFRAFWDNSPFNQTIKDAQGRIVLVNDQYERSYGLPAEQLEGRTLDEAHRAGWAREIDDLDSAVADSGSTRVSDVIVYDNNGTRRTIRLTKFPVRNAAGEITGVGGISYDITDQVSAAHALRESELRFRMTFEQAAVGIAHVSLDGRWLRTNRRYRELVGYSEAELAERTFRDITHPDDFEADLRYRTDLVDGRINTYTNEKRYIRKDGRTIWVAATASKSPAVGTKEPYVIVVVQDIGDRKRAEEALAGRVRQQAAIVDLGRNALETRDLDKFLRTTADMVADTLGVDACTIAQVYHDPLRFLVRGASADINDFTGRVFSPQGDHVKEKYLLVANRTTVFEDRHRDIPALRSPILDAVGTVGGASVVIGETENPFGILFAHSRSPRRFSDDDVNFLQAVANTVATKLSSHAVESALAEREQTLNAVMDNAADGIIATDEDGTIQIFNNAAEEIFGLDSEAAKGRALRSFIPMSYGTTVEGEQDAGSSPYSLREMKGLRADGSTVPIDLAMTTVDTPSGRMHIAIIRDVSAQKAMQTQLIQASKLATVGEMAAGIAHELNQPLNIMRMAADNVLIRMESGSADLEYAAKNLEMISDQAGRMGKIILHMRVFSRQETTDFVPFDPSAAVRSACELMRSQIELEDIELSVDLPETCDTVAGQASQLEQVIINIISNARDAIREQRFENGEKSGSDRITVTTERAPDTGNVRIRVKDTGGGISDAVMQRIFDPFFTTKEVGVGTGLGLSVSYGIVTSMGGTISATNDGAGCNFTIELPVRRSEATEEARVSR